MTEQKKNVPILKIIIVLVIFLLVILATYVITIKLTNKEDKSENNSIAEEEVNLNNDEVVSLTLQEADNLVAKYTTCLDFYCTNIFDETKEFNSKKVGLVYEYLNLNEDNSYETSTECSMDPNSDGVVIIDNREYTTEAGCSLLSYDVLNNAYNELFGEDMPKQNFTYLTSIYVYIDSTNSFERYSFQGGGAGYPIKRLYKVTEVEKNNESIDVKVAYAELSDEQETGYLLLNGQESIKYTQLEVDSQGFEETFFNTHLDVLEIYTFSFENHDGNYVLKNVVK